MIRRLPGANARLPKLNRKHIPVRGQNGGSLRVAMAILWRVRRRLPVRQRMCNLVVLTIPSYVVRSGRHPIRRNAAAAHPGSVPAFPLRLESA